MPITDLKYDECIWIYMDYADYHVIGFSTPKTSNKMISHWNYIYLVPYDSWFSKYRAFTFNTNLKLAIDGYFIAKGFTP